MVTRALKKKGKNTGRKSGGQPGNKNAMRHGFYANRFTDEQKKKLDGQDATDLQAEINLIRVCLDQLYDQLYFEAEYLPNKDGGQSNIRDDHYLKQLNTLSIMTQSLSTLARTQYLIKGKGGDVADAIMHALEELRLEMGI
jgi:hypothetical protein